MSATPPQPDPATEIVQAERLDELLVAIQHEDVARRDEILRDHPEFRGLVSCLLALDGLTPRAEPPMGPTGEHLTPSTSDPLMPTLVPGRWTRSRQESSSELPRTFGKYELLEEIGRGGMGVIFKARQTDLNRIVAVKMIRESDLATDEEIRRFRIEAQAAARLRHRNVVGIHEVGEEHGRHYFAMDYVEGKTLAEVVAGGILSPEKAARWMASIAMAVQHLHNHGIVHRDLKPSNVLIDQAGEPMVADFGLAKVFDSGTDATRSGAIIGTPSYMSPEQAAGRSSLVNERSDIYSLGAMLYEMLSGRPPFREETPLDTLVQVIEGEPTLLRQLVKSIPRDLELICFKCLEKDPDRRYRTAADLATDLNHFLKGEPIDAQLGSPLQTVLRWSRRQPNLAVHLVALFLAASLTHIWHLWEGSNQARHGGVMLTLAAWAGSALVCQQLFRRDRHRMLSRIGTIVGDAVFLTMALFLAGFTDGTMLVVYPLCVAASGLWFRTRLVWLATFAAELAVMSLFLIQPELRRHWHHPLIVMMVLLLTGATTAFQVNRVRALSRYYSARGHE